MHYKQNTSVFTPSGENVGQIDRVVMDPKTREVTYLVVRKGFLLTEDKVVPIALVRDANDERVTLEQEAGTLDDLPPFEETQYLPMDWEERPSEDFNPNRTRTEDVPSSTLVPSAPSLFWYPSVGMEPLGYSNWAGPTYVAKTATNIPSDAVALKKGASVIANDDKDIGSVEEVITQSQDNKATHFVVSQGLIFKTHKAIPVQWISDVTDNEVKLGVHSDLLERLPEYQPS
jgi:uncharacterized protein YrrD